VNTWNGEEYSETFSQGDTIGCGYDADNKAVFFTKNGKFLGVAMKHVSYNFERCFPGIGTWELNDEVWFNFGKQPFLFPIYSYAINPELFITTSKKTDENS